MYCRKPYMAEKYAIGESENYQNLYFERICRYAEGYIYRIQKQCTSVNNKPWECRLLFQSARRNKIYLTEWFEQIIIHMTDFEHGVAYATGIEVLNNEIFEQLVCADKVWKDEDTQLFKKELKIKQLEEVLI